MNDELIQVVAKTLKLNPSHVSNDTSPNNTAEWDSLATMKLIIEIEDYFKVSFSIDEIMAMKSLLDIRNMLLLKGVANA